MGYNNAKENMNKNYILRFKIQLGIFIIAGLLLSLIYQPAYAENKNAKNKLFAIVVPITKGSPKKGWHNPNEEYIKNTYKHVRRLLTESGVYELIPLERIEMIKKERKIKDQDWEKNDWAILKKVGKALGADYAFVRERGHSGDAYSSMTLININTGKIFEYYDYKTDSYPGAFDDVVKKSYREVFRLAKSDLIATAMMKVTGKDLPSRNEPEKTVEEKKPVEPPKETPKIEDKKTKKEIPQIIELAKPSEEKKLSGAQIEPQKIEDKEIKNKTPNVIEQKQAKPSEEKKLSVVQKDSKTPLIVYDFNTNEQLKVIALLLAEALRDELSSKFKIIAREETLKAADEIKLQQSGFVDEKYMMNVGKWLSAKEAVSGTFGIIGKTYMLQAKRINMETLEMLSSGSIKVSVDKEEDLLNGLQDIAVNLSGSK